jgi:hypothetical protein
MRYEVLSPLRKGRSLALCVRTGTDWEARFWVETGRGLKASAAFPRAARQSRFSVRSWAAKPHRGDIVIGRPAISLKAWPSTHDTISHL